MRCTQTSAIPTLGDSAPQHPTETFEEHAISPFQPTNIDLFLTDCDLNSQCDMVAFIFFHRLANREIRIPYFALSLSSCRSGPNIFFCKAKARNPVISPVPLHIKSTESASYGFFDRIRSTPSKCNNILWWKWSKAASRIPPSNILQRLPSVAMVYTDVTQGNSARCVVE